MSVRHPGGSLSLWPQEACAKEQAGGSRQPGSSELDPVLRGPPEGGVLPANQEAPTSSQGEAGARGLGLGRSPTPSGRSCGLQPTPQPQPSLVRAWPAACSAALPQEGPGLPGSTEGSPPARSSQNTGAVCWLCQSLGQPGPSGPALGGCSLSSRPSVVPGVRWARFPSSQDQPKAVPQVLAGHLSPGWPALPALCQTLFLPQTAIYHPVTSLLSCSKGPAGQQPCMALPASHHHPRPVSPGVGPHLAPPQAQRSELSALRCLQPDLGRLPRQPSAPTHPSLGCCHGQGAGTPTSSSRHGHLLPLSRLQQGPVAHCAQSRLPAQTGATPWPRRSPGRTRVWAQRAQDPMERASPWNVP